MPKFSISGNEIQGVTEAHVKIYHRNPNAPDPVPNMEWNLRIRLQHEDTIPKWALAKQSADRFKKCELVIKNRTDEEAHTWTLLNAFVASYDEVEHPATDASGSHEGGYFLDLTLRGHMQEALNYTGDNIMQVKAGKAPTTAS